MSKLRMLTLVGLLAAALTPLYGCGSECADGTTDKDGQCVVAANGCAEGTTLQDGECVLDTTGCTGGTTLFEGECVPSGEICESGSTFDEGARTCVPDTEVVCGEGTSIGADGWCVPGDGACNDLTELNAEGRCVITAAACTEGTTLDPTTGDCLPAEAACGEGLGFDADTRTCVPTEALCDAGTAFDADTQLCLPDSCHRGDVLADGVCMTPAEELAGNVDLTETENNDPAFGGTAETLFVNAIGDDPYVFEGNISAPTDLDTDGEVDQDVDVFEFEAEGAGEWYEIMVQSTGLQAPAFIVEGPNDFVRYSPVGRASAAARKIVTPESGFYTITVLPSLVLQSNGEVSRIGGDDWGYVGGLKSIDAPDATDTDLSAGDAQLSGNYLDLNDNLFTLSGLQLGDIVRFEVNSTGADAQGLVQLWDSTNTLVETNSTSGGAFEFVATEATATVLFDWVKMDGPKDGFDVSASVTGVQKTEILPPGNTAQISVTAENKDQILVSQSNPADESLKVVITDSLAAEFATNDALDSGAQMLELVETPDTYTVTFTNESTAQIDATLTVKVLPPIDLGQLPVGPSTSSAPFDLPEESFRNVTFTVGAGEIFRIGHTNTEESYIGYELYAPDGSLVAEETYFYDIWSGPANYDYFVSEGGGQYELKVIAPSSIWSDTSRTNLQLVAGSSSLSDLGQLSQTDSASDSQPNALAADEYEFYQIELTEQGFLDIDASTPQNQDVDVYVFDSSFGYPDSSTTETDEQLMLDLDAGTYYILIHAFAALPSYTLDLELLGPITGTPAFSSTVGQVIPDNDTSNPLTDTLTVTGCTTISDVNVYVDITHPDASEMDIHITSPQGTVVHIFDQESYTEEDLVGWFPRPFMSDEPLSNFFGETGNGDWMISIVDNWSSDGSGPLNSWGLTLDCQ